MNIDNEEKTYLKLKFGARFYSTPEDIRIILDYSDELITYLSARGFSVTGRLSSFEEIITVEIDEENKLSSFVEHMRLYDHNK